MLVNANYLTHEINLTEMGEGVTMLVAGKQPVPIQFGFIPWGIRSLLLIPLIQTNRRIRHPAAGRRWQLDPQCIPSRGRLWGLHFLLPAFLNLILTASGVAVLTSNVRGFLLLFMPDLSWLAMISGGFALAWTFLRTNLDFADGSKTWQCATRNYLKIKFEESRIAKKFGTNLVSFIMRDDLERQLLDYQQVGR